MTATAPLPEWTPHPVLAVPTREQCMAWGMEKTIAVWEKREELIRNEREDAFRFAYILPTWRKADEFLQKSLVLAIFGGGGAAKSHYCCWRGVRMLVEKEARVLFLHESERASIDTHQRFVYHYLPREWKPTEDTKIKRTLTTKVNYSIATGFTDNTFVLPNRSQAVFGSYKQDVGDYEGGGWSLIVVDENCPLSWLTTLVFRLPRSGGKLLWPFTPIKGITPAVKHVVQGAVTIESRRAELLPEDHRVREDQDWPAGHMPFVQRCVHPRWHAMFFFTEDNPFAGYEEQKLLAVGQSVELVERRFYGLARNTTRTLLPRFSAVHIVEPEAIPTDRVSNFHVLDPAGVRNIFQLWVSVDEHGRHFVRDEWPDVPALGEWAVPSESPNKWDGDSGPAQATVGYGVEEYKKLILEREGNKLEADGWRMCGLAIEERIVDPRSGATESIAERDGGSSLIDRFEEEQKDRSGKIVLGPSIELVAAPGKREAEGIEAINDLLAYDPSRPVTAFINEPKLFVSSKCQNLIWAMQNYTGHDGEKAACKDPVDCLRYVALAELEYAPAGRTRQGRVKSY